MSSDQNILVKLKDAGFQINDKWLVKGVSLQVEKGKIVTLIGPNGSGKSTTAKIALGIYKKIDGSVEKNTDKIGYVPQKISIDWTLPLRVYDFMLLTENLDEETINNALSITGVSHLKDKNLGDLSGGEFQRVLMARAIAKKPDLLVLDGSDDSSFRLRMTETQIKARQDFAIEQNITTLRNRVNQLGVAEPLVQRQGVDRIVVQLPGVQDPNRLDDILTATATLEFHLADNGGNFPGSRRYTGRPGVPSQNLRREIIASGDQIIDAESGFSQGQPAVFITLDAAGGESMLKTTRENLNKPMSTVFIETRRITETNNGIVNTKIIKTEEIISTATIRGIFKDRFQITGLTPIEARELAL